MPGSNFHPESENPAVSKRVAGFRTGNGLTPGAPAAMMDKSLFVVRRCSISRKVTGAHTDLPFDREKTTEILGSLDNHLVPITGQLTCNANGEALRSTHLLVVKNPNCNSMR
ncbi:MAG: hypothetical protein EXR27_07430 [Betaproteobacteria bacterium]|nr:hypothetical protein [Betaproteobacteria bacterium]